MTENLTKNSTVEENSSFEFKPLLGLVAVAFLVRLLLLSKSPFHWDSIDFIVCGRETLDNLSISYAHGTGFPLIVLLASFTQILSRIFGINEVPAFLGFTALVASLSLIPFYAFCRHFQSKIGALISCALFAFFPTFFSITTYGRLDHALSLLLACSAFGILSDKISLKKQAIFGAILFGLAGASRLPILFTLPFWVVAFVWMHKKQWKQATVKIAIIFVPVFAVACFGLYLPLWIKDPSKGPFAQGTNSVANIRGASYWLGLFSPVFYQRALVFIQKSFTWLGLLASFAGGAIFLRKDKLKFFFVLSYLILSISYFGNIACLAPRYLIAFSIPLIVFQGVLFEWFYEKRRKLAVFAVLIFVLTINSGLLPIMYQRTVFNGQESFTMFLDKVLPKNAVLLSKDELIFHKYYSKRKDVHFDEFPTTLKREVMDQFAAQMKQWEAEGKKIFITQSGFTYDPKKLFFEVVSNNYDVILVGDAKNEDWHRKSLRTGIFQEKLFFLKRKP